MAKQKLRVIPLGGLGEIGKNMMALEFDNDIIVIDSGLMFPKEDQYGVDLVIPDISYLLENRQNVRAIIITHGHEDHTGALPFVLRELKVPVYATRLTLGLISVKLKEHRLKNEVKLIEATPGVQYSLGKFKVEFFSVCHSIPDAAGLIIRTPVGTVVHSGDFKFDHTPVTGQPCDLGHLAQVAVQQPLLLMSDSTYAELPGYTPSERRVGETLDHIFAQAQGRIIVTTFSSLISRVQQVLDAAAAHGRYVFVVGRSMTENVRISRELGFLTDTGNMLRSLDQIKGVPLDKIALITTGSQGEPTSALVRISNRDHKQLHIVPGDTVVMSATPVPGNEALVNRTIDNLFRQGAKVLWDRVAMVHVHGHASQEELKMLLTLVRPKYFMPIHGEYRHLCLHAELAHSLGMPIENTFVMDDGDVLELNAKGARIAGKVQAGPIYVNGLSVGDIGGVILRDRRLLSQDGIVVAIVAMDKRDGSLVGRPDIVSRGFVDENESKELLDQGRDLLAQSLTRGGPHVAEWGYVSGKTKETLSHFFYEQTKRRPMIVPVLVEV
ncbi:MAG: ribonuclease J [Dehalococcoidia bacterium]|nr:ribonuclease J [Dehalococcoidia bacterium]